MPVTPRFATDQIKQSVVANTSSLYYFDVGTTTTTIAGLPKTGSTPETVATVAPNAFPGGIAADDAHVAWLTTLYFPTTGTESSCTINMTTVTAPRTEVQLLSTNKFSCTDVAIGGGHVYFPIVEAFSADSGPLVRNVGIGRIDLVSQVFESIELGIPGPEAGPRQVFVDGDGIIVVAPFVIARIEQRELTGKHEIDK